MSLLPVVVLRSNDYSYLGIIRSCFRVNVPVYSIVFTWDGAGPWFSAYSNCETERYNISNPYTDENEAVKQLCFLGEELLIRHNQKKLMLIPSSDTNLMFIQNNYTQLCKYFLIMGGVDFNSSRMDVIDKGLCAQLLSKKGVDIPVTYPCRSKLDIEPVTKKMTFPCIYKPAIKDYSQSFYKIHNSKKAIECSDAVSLRLSLKAEIDRGFSLVVQEKIIFDSALEEIPVYLYVNAHHEITMFASGIKRNIEPFPFGTAIDLEYFVQDELFDKSQEVVEALKWRGILMIEFIFDEARQDWVVIEVNTRPWLMSDFYSRCGMNYIEHLLADLKSMPVEFKSLTHTCPPRRHIDLLLLFKQHRFNIDQVEGYLADVNADISFTYIDQYDPLPGMKQIEHIAKQGMLSYDQVFSLARKFSSDY